METLFLFLVKSSGLIAMFYLAYFVLLRKETFFNSNRWFLLSGLITSVILPLIVFTKIVWVDPILTTIDWAKIPVKTTTPIENEAFEVNWYFVFGIIYSIGILGFLIKFAFDFYSLSKVLKGKTIQHQANFQFIDVSENIAPFSYFKSIVYNSSLYSDTELENILEHEKVHSLQNHTIDVLVSRLFCIVFWFNPLVWLYKKAIVQNLEFIADSEASKNISDKKAYQLTLLKITTQENCVAITNHFYQSLIKKRIVMLNKNQSNKRNSWKYAIVLPLLGAFLFLFQVKVVAQEKLTMKQETKVKEAVDLTKFKIEKDLTPLSKGKEIDVNNQKITTNKINADTLKTQKPIIILDGTQTVSNFNINDIPTDKIVSIDVLKAETAEEKYGVNGKYGVIEILTKNSSYLISKSKNNTEKPMIIINGKKAGSEVGMNNINSDAIKSINVFKGKSAMGKYGKEGENGVIEITTETPDIIITKVVIGKPILPATPTVKEEKQQDKVVNGWKVNTKHLSPSKKEILEEIDKVDYRKAVIIIDGKISNSRKMDKLDPDQIVSIYIQKISDGSEKFKQEKIKEYGDKVLNGLIEVETKKLYK